MTREKSQIEEGVIIDTEQEQVPDSEAPTEYDESMQLMYGFRLNMARARATKLRILQGQMEALDLSYAKQRAHTDRQLLATDNFALMLFTASEIVDRENLPANGWGALSDAKKAFRKLMFRHLLENHEKIIIDLRIAVASAGRETITGGKLAAYIFEAHLAPLVSELSAKNASYLKINLNPTRDPRDSLQDLTFNYPVIENQEINIYNIPQLESFYGQLLSCVSGMNRHLYEAYECRRKAVRHELNNYSAATLDGLPTLDSLGETGEQLRIHLLQKLFHARIEKQTPSPTIPSPIDYPEALLTHYNDFGKGRETRAMIEAFEALPRTSFLTEGVSRILNKTTRRRIIQQLSEQLISPWLLEQVYQMMCAIYDLQRLGKAGKPEASAMAEQFGSDLLLFIKRAGSIKKPADPSILESLFMELTDTIQLAKFCFQELKKA